MEAAAGPDRAAVTPADPVATPIWEAIDWSRAWLQPCKAIGRPVEQAVRRGIPVWEALNLAGRAPVRFVPQVRLPAGMAYERFIFETACCPTRDGLHDFFNGLCWLHFPQTKRRLNQLQAAQIAADGVRPVRGPVRDALTLFDENAAFLRAPDALWDALQAKHWQALFGPLRPLWQQARLLLFGHALLEKLQAPRKAITAHVYRVNVQADTLHEIDDWMAQDLEPARLATKPFAHLPVLGVPSWWPANAHADFYDDPAVFRAPRTKPGAA